MTSRHREAKLKRPRVLEFMCWIDHHLVSSVLSLHITPMSRKTAKSCRPAFDNAKLKQPERSCMFAKDLDDRLTAHGPLSGPQLNNGNISRLW